NGVSASEFEPVPVRPDATDLVFIGELRLLKGVDILIDAIALLRDRGRVATLTMVGDGPGREAFRSQAERLRLQQLIRFVGTKPAREAQALGRVMVVPSRMESLPYVVLEAAASGKPLIATRAGAIPEFYGPLAISRLPAAAASAPHTAGIPCAMARP